MGLDSEEVKWHGSCRGEKGWVGGFFVFFLMNSGTLAEAVTSGLVWGDLAKSNTENGAAVRAETDRTLSKVLSVFFLFLHPSFSSLPLHPSGIRTWNVWRRKSTKGSAPGC